MVATSSPDFTCCPSFTAILAIFPVIEASILVSIFIASITAIGCFSLTSSPSLTSIFSMLPGIGAPISAGSFSSAYAITFPAVAIAPSLSFILTALLVPLTSNVTYLYPSSSPCISRSRTPRVPLASLCARRPLLALL